MTSAGQRFMRRAFLANLAATAVAGPLGALVQQQLSFEIVAIDLDSLAQWPLTALVVLVMGQLAGWIAGSPVDAALARLAPRLHWLGVPISAGLAVAIFAWTLPWELKEGELPLLLGLTAAFFGVRRLWLLQSERQGQGAARVESGT